MVAAQTQFHQRGLSPVGFGSNGQLYLWLGCLMAGDELGGLVFIQGSGLEKEECLTGDSLRAQARSPPDSGVMGLGICMAGGLGEQVTFTPSLFQWCHCPPRWAGVEEADVCVAVRGYMSG
jgi:hypothetical protein